MDEMTLYNGRVSEIAATCFARDLSSRDATDDPVLAGRIVTELAPLRAEFMTADETWQTGYLALPHFEGLADEIRLAAFFASFDLEDAITKLELRRRFRRYNPDQPLFVLSPTIWPRVRKAELVPASIVCQHGDSELVEVPNGWARIDGLLPGDLLRWAHATFKAVPIYVRLDPWFASVEQPLQRLEEAVVRPSRPGWWKNLGLRKRERDGGHYVLQDPGTPTPATRDEFWEYKVAGVRSLEVHAERDKVGNLSAMIEELVDCRRPDGRVIGRCIHFDTDAPSGTDVSVAQLNHLDLAINMYFGEDAATRQSMRLCDGKVQDASVRTHLFRIEGVPVPSVAEFARRFFKSSILLTQWMRDQFDGEADPYSGT